MTLSITRPSDLPPADGVTDVPCRVKRTKVPARVCRPQPFREAQQDRGGAAGDPFISDDHERSPSNPDSYLSQRRMP
jgi:hypothetical protein